MWAHCRMELLMSTAGGFFRAVPGRRAVLSVISVLTLVAATITVGTYVAPAVASAAIPGQGTPFDCYGGIIYSAQQSNPASTSSAGVVNAITTSTLAGTTPVT